MSQQQQWRWWFFSCTRHHCIGTRPTKTVPTDPPDQPNIYNDREVERQKDNIHISIINISNQWPFFRPNWIGRRRLAKQHFCFGITLRLASTYFRVPYGFLCHRSVVIVICGGDLNHCPKICVWSDLLHSMWDWRLTAPEPLRSNWEGVLLLLLLLIHIKHSWPCFIRQTNK